MEGVGLDDAVALVEDAEDRDPLGHRSHSALPRGGRRRLPRRRSANLLLVAAAARGERERNQQRCSGFRHAYSGIQGS